MFRHTVLFRWTPDANVQQKSAAISALTEWKGVASEFGVLDLVVDEGLTSGNADAAVTVDFPTREAYLAYTNDPRHKRMIALHIAPILAHRLAVQGEI